MKNMNKIMMILVAILAITTAMTPAWGQTFSTTFSRCYDCWRNPEYPSRGSGTSFTVNLYNFSTDSPNWGQGVSNSSPGDWTVAYDGVYSSNTAKYNQLASNINISSFKSSSGLAASDPLPVYDLKKNGVHIAYGFLSAYANENNNHIALFIAEGWSGGYGCFLTESTTTPQDANYTFTKDLKDLSANPIPEPVVNYTLTLYSNNTQYGTVSAEGTGITPNNNGTYTVPSGTEVTVTANPNPGSHFVNWDGDQNLTNPTRQITVSSNQTITANFDYKIYNVPDGWTVKANNESVNVTNGTTDGIQDGKTVKITPAPGQKILTVKMKKKTN